LKWTDYKDQVKGIMDKKKATISDIKKDIAPYLKKSFLSKAYIESADVEMVCRLMRRKYKNVDIGPHPGRDGHSYLKICVKALLFPTEVEYEIRVKGRRNRTRDPLSWIDRIEEMQ
jgi:hypothetical protein